MKTPVKDYLKEYRISMQKVVRIRNMAEARGISAEERDRELRRHLEKATEIEAFISSAKNIIHREVLTRKYIYGETAEQIAESMNYSPRHITRLVASAICSLERSAEHTPS